MITGKQRSMTGQFASCASFFTNSYLGITYFSRDYKRNDVRGVVDAYAASKIKSSVIRKKGESQNGCFKKTKLPKFSEKQTFLTPWYAQEGMRIWGKKCSFFGKFGVLCFLETPVLTSCLLAYYRRSKLII